MRRIVFRRLLAGGAVVTTTRRSKPAPKSLGVEGLSLWRALTREFDFNSAELSLLAQLCCTTDEIADLKAALTATGPVVRGSTGQDRANPLLAEIRNHRKLADQLVVALGLPIDGEQVGRRRSSQQKQAADARWRKTKTKGRMQTMRKIQGGASDGETA
jgi:P27 family predicted phage terminase small subunit